MEQITHFIDHPPKFLYERLIRRKKGNSAFTILIFFLLAFILSRSAIYLSFLHLLPPSPLENIFGTHVHHFVLGIFLVSIIGLFTLTIPHSLFLRWRLKFAALYGFGLGWIVDEFGMWLKLENNYFLRSSFDAIVILTILLLNYLYFSKIWWSFITKFSRAFRHQLRNFFKSNR